MGAASGRSWTRTPRRSTSSPHAGCRQQLARCSLMLAWVGQTSRVPQRSRSVASWCRARGARGSRRGSCSGRQRSQRLPRRCSAGRTRRSLRARRPPACPRAAARTRCGSCRTKDCSLRTGVGTSARGSRPALGRVRGRRRRRQACPVAPGRSAGERPARSGRRGRSSLGLGRCPVGRYGRGRRCGHRATADHGLQRRGVPRRRHASRPRCLCRSAREQAAAGISWSSSAVRHAPVVLRAARARAIPSGVTVPGQPPRQSRSNAPS